MNFSISDEYALFYCGDFVFIIFVSRGEKLRLSFGFLVRNFITWALKFSVVLPLFLQQGVFVGLSD